MTRASTAYKKTKIGVGKEFPIRSKDQTFQYGQGEGEHEESKRRREETSSVS